MLHFDPDCSPVNVGMGYHSDGTGGAAGRRFHRGLRHRYVAMNYPGGVKSVRVEEGVVYIQESSLSEEEKAELRKILSDTIRGHQG